MILSVLCTSLLDWAQIKPPALACAWPRGLVAGGLVLVRTDRPGAGGLVRTGRPDRNAAVIPLCPSLLHAAALREGETPLGRAERGAVRDVARVGQRRRAGAGRRGGGRGGTASWPAGSAASRRGGALRG